MGNEGTDEVDGHEGASVARLGHDCGSWVDKNRNMIARDIMAFHGHEEELGVFGSTKKDLAFPQSIYDMSYLFNLTFKAISLAETPLFSIFSIITSQGNLTRFPSDIKYMHVGDFHINSRFILELLIKMFNKYVQQSRKLIKYCTNRVIYKIEQIIKHFHTETYH